MATTITNSLPRLTSINSIVGGGTRGASVVSATAEICENEFLRFLRSHHQQPQQQQQQRQENFSEETKFKNNNHNHNASIFNTNNSYNNGLEFALSALAFVTNKNEESHRQESNRQIRHLLTTVADLVDQLSDKTENNKQEMINECESSSLKTQQILESVSNRMKNKLRDTLQLLQQEFEREMKNAQNKIIQDLIGGATLRNISKLTSVHHDLQDGFAQLREKYLQS